MQQEKKKRRIRQLFIQNNTYIIFIILFIVCCLLSENFLTVMNLRNIALQQAAPICVAIGMLFVILTGGIDLSVGSVMAFGAALTAILIRDFSMNLFLAILISLAAGLLMGTFIGVLVAYTKMQGFVASLAMMTIARGMAFVLTNGTPIKLDKGYLDLLVKKELFYPIIIITVLIVVIFWFI